MSNIEVVDWSPRWAEQSEEVAVVLREAMTGLDAAVEHVGSTSVPGLAAKPILDIDVVVDATDVPAAVAALESVGYEHRGDLGVTGREAFHAPGPHPPAQRPGPGRLYETVIQHGGIFTSVPRVSG